MRPPSVTDEIRAERDLAQARLERIDRIVSDFEAVCHPGTSPLVLQLTRRIAAALAFVPKQDDGQESART